MKEKVETVLEQLEKGISEEVETKVLEELRGLKKEDKQALSEALMGSKLWAKHYKRFATALGLEDVIKI